MSEPAQYKYRAFISYSHVDATWAKWLHASIEGFRIDQDLAGRDTTAGKIPKTLRPVFRDREEFAAGHSLNEQTLAALDASSALIVICSPDSAKSLYVNEEIRLFKSRHPERPVIPVIVGGKPGDADRECFPRTLRRKIGPLGEITDASEPDILAADAREEGDGKSLALAKVVARLVGLSTDEVFRRAERDRRRQRQVRNGVLGVLATLATATIAISFFAASYYREATGQCSVASKYAYETGYFEKHDSAWEEHANGRRFAIFRELRTDATFVYLADKNRLDPIGGANRPEVERREFIVRIPKCGGQVEWSWSNPLEWTAFQIVSR
jgi:hypothetical protein